MSLTEVQTRINSLTLIRTKNSLLLMSVVLIKITFAMCLQVQPLLRGGIGFNGNPQPPESLVDLCGRIYCRPRDFPLARCHKAVTAVSPVPVMSKYPREPPYVPSPSHGDLLIETRLTMSGEDTVDHDGLVLDGDINAFFFAVEESGILRPESLVTSTDTYECDTTRTPPRESPGFELVTFDAKDRSELPTPAITGPSDGRSPARRAGMQVIDRRLDTSPPYFINRGVFSDEQKSLIQKFSHEALLPSWIVYCHILQTGQSLSPTVKSRALLRTSAASRRGGRRTARGWSRSWIHCCAISTRLQGRW